MDRQSPVFLPSGFGSAGEQARACTIGCGGSPGHRRYSLAGEIDDRRGQQLLTDLKDLPVERYSHTILLQRICQLRTSLTAYDAAYVALAEALDAPLLTCDERLAATPGHGATIELLSGE